MGGRVTESSFPLPPTPFLMGDWVRNLLFLFLLPPVLWVTGYGIFFSSSSYPLSYGWLGTESSFPLPPTPCLMGDRVRNLLFLFLLPSVLIVSILWPQADHPNCSRHGDVTCDMWSHTFTFFLKRPLSAVFYEAFLPITESSWERRSHVARDITMPRTVWMVRLWYDIYSGNTDTHVPKKKTLPCSMRQFFKPQFLYLYYISLTKNLLLCMWILFTQLP